MAAESSRGRERKRKKKEEFDEVMEQADSLLADLDEKKKAEKGTKARKRADTTLYFFKDPVTGRSITHCEYRPKGVPRKDQGEDFEDSASTVSDDMTYSDTEATSMSTVSSASDLESTLKEADVLLKEWKKKAPLHQRWNERISSLNESWEDHREDLLKSILCTHAVADSTCDMCDRSNAPICCHHCHKYKRLCGPCDQTAHEYFPFHDAV